MNAVYNKRKQVCPRSMPCEECGLSYTRSPSDRRIHRRYHGDTIYGVKARLTNHDRIIWRDEGRLVSVVDSSSPMERKKYAEKVAVVAKRGTPFDFPAYIAGEGPDRYDTHAFMLDRDGRTIGLLVAGKGTHIWPCTWAQYDQGEQPMRLTDVPEMWSLYYVWIAPAHRREGLAQLLFGQAACFLGILPDQFGCCPPFTELGETWARRTWPVSFYVVK
jgi:GNAT superfamily N-acetyltransferase